MSRNVKRKVGEFELGHGKFGRLGMAQEETLTRQLSLSNTAPRYPALYNA